MKATVLKGIGGIDKLEYTGVKTPAVKENYSLVKVEYCGINHLDILIRQGKRVGPKSFPHILGSEIVGEVNGEKVLIFPWIFCGSCKQCLNGNENICDNGGTIGRTQWGGYAEYILVPSHNLIKIPESSDLEKICAIALAGTTAYHLVKRLGVKNKSVVLVTGATGGVGTIILQLLKNTQCKIVAATSHPNKAESLKKLGATEVVSTDNLVEEVKKIFPQGVDYAADLVGGSTWSKVVEVLGKNGTLAFCATSLEEPGQVNIVSVFARQLNILGSTGGTREDTKKVIELVNKGEINPLIDSIYPLKDASLAHQKIDEQKILGKILLRVDNN